MIPPFANLPELDLVIFNFNNSFSLSKGKITFASAFSSSQELKFFPALIKLTRIIIEHNKYKTKAA